MGTVDVFTKARAKAIEDNTVVAGLVDSNGNLLLEKHNGTQINAGNVKGPKGDNVLYPIPNVDALSYIRIAILEGSGNPLGAHYQGVISGIGSRTSDDPPRRSTLTFQASQRNADKIDLKAWVFNPNDTLKMYTRKISTYTYEIWIKVPAYQNSVTLMELSSWNSIRTLDSVTTSAPTDLIEITIRDIDTKITSSSSIDVLGDGNTPTPYQLTVKTLEPAMFKTGLLESTYRGGPAKVKIDGALSSSTIPWLTTYNPLKSREVNLMKMGTSWVITGQKEETYVNISLNSTYVELYSGVQDSTYGLKIKATKLPSGLITLSGLLRFKTSVPKYTTIGSVPVGYRPDNSVVLPVLFSDTAASICIKPNGDVDVWFNVPTAGGYLSLDGGSFWSAGIAQWINIGDAGSSLGSNVDANPTSTWVTDFGYPSFWKDPYGFVWHRGLLRVTTTISSDNTILVNMPAAYRAEKQEHHRATFNEGYGGIGSAVASGLTWKASSPGAVGTWISIHSPVVRTAEATANNPWYTQLSLVNGWLNGSTSQGQYASWLLREDGLRMLSGFMTSGTIGQSSMLMMAEEMIPENRQLIIARIANNASSRIDIRGTNANLGDPGRIFMTSGSNAWFTLDGTTFVP